MNDTIVVKIGTESLMDFEQSEKVQKLVDTIISQTKQGIRILLVTSGAVGFGRKTPEVYCTEYSCCRNTGNPRRYRREQ